MSNLLNIPNELVLLIVSLLDDASKLSLGITCKKCLRPFLIKNSNNLKFNRSNIIISSIRNSYTNLFNLYTPELNCISDHHLMLFGKTAAEVDNMEILQILLEKCDSFSNYAGYMLRAAVRSGNLHIVKWLRSVACIPWDTDACNDAAANGHLEILKYLQKQAYPMSVSTYVDAAANGHLEIIKWLRENGYSWNELVCSYASRNDHYEILKWLHDNGCPWDKLTIINAKSYKVLKYAHDNGCECDRHQCEYCGNPYGRYGHFKNVVKDC